MAKVSQLKENVYSKELLTAAEDTADQCGRTKTAISVTSMGSGIKFKSGL